MMVLRVLTALGLMFLASACSSTVHPAQHALPAEARNWPQETISELNRYRLRQNLEPLQTHPGLGELSLNHSARLLNERNKGRSKVNHKGSGQRAKLARTEFGMIAWGENVAYISGTPEDVATKLIAMWKASPPHHKAMIGNWTHVGVGICMDEDGAIFATMNFGRLKPHSQR